jgi:hypothetical protein
VCIAESDEALVQRRPPPVRQQDIDREVEPLRRRRVGVDRRARPLAQRRREARVIAVVMRQQDRRHLRAQRPNPASSCRAPPARPRTASPARSPPAADRPTTSVFVAVAGGSVGVRNAITPHPAAISSNPRTPA